MFGVGGDSSTRPAAGLELSAAERRRGTPAAALQAPSVWGGHGKMPHRCV